MTRAVLREDVEAEAKAIAQVGRNIAIERERAGMTQERLSAAMGISQGAVGNWERGARAPTVTSLFRIAKALKVKPEKLLKGL